MTPTYWLSLHRPYACRDAGACCSAGWDIPIERRQAARVQPLAAGRHWLRPVADGPADVAGWLVTTDGGHCLFHDRGCEIQRAYGHAALPVACQHFPRDVLLDPRGVLVTLSHYCPTAADLLFDHTGPVTIVEGPEAVPGGTPEGLNARDVLPPLLTEGVLTDLEGYAAWEAHMVAELCADDDRTPEEAVEGLRADARRLAAWRPGGLTLAAAVRSLPGARRPGAPPSRGQDGNRVIRRYLAARAFASWVAYQGRGVPAVVGSLVLTLAALRQEMDRVAPDGGRELSRALLKECIRHTDLRLVHLTERDEFARRASSVPA